MIVFHRFLIGTFVLFSLGLAAWSYMFYQASGGGMSLAMAVGSTLAAVGFSYYLRHLQRFLRL